MACGTGPIATEKQFPCQTLVACLRGSLRGSGPFLRRSTEGVAICSVIPIARVCAPACQVDTAGGATLDDIGSVLTDCGKHASVAVKGADEKWSGRSFLRRFLSRAPQPLFGSGTRRNSRRGGSGAGYCLVGGGGGGGCAEMSGWVGPKSPRREVVRSSAGAGVIYPPFLGSFA